MKLIQENACNSEAKKQTINHKQQTLLSQPITLRNNLIVFSNACNRQKDEDNDE